MFDFGAAVVGLGFRVSLDPLNSKEPTFVRVYIRKS